MTDLFDESEGQTPLSEEEKEGLKQNWIATRADLNAAEQLNIAAAAKWAYRRKPANPLTDRFVRQLHDKMFSEVWGWAGEYRQTSRNIGIDAYRIRIEVPALLEELRYWIENRTFPPDEIAVRAHHKLVYIHPFPNGNGRHARLFSDLLITDLGSLPFTWGRGNLQDATATRQNYIAALRAADRHDIGPLIDFSRA